ncbi:hypothetical protein [Pedobacter caeni]|uniref:Uncharacterized protein n=1 Tax=Pedobacter caeni TaxID=288992 RepID=A0A1M4W7X1_9SPHI|nr:hypothetical protein [Pedobacter caeni]SHE77072.1 hypothetical protein SAMN04488522_1011161 [Pedobacter caeni]
MKYVFFIGALLIGVLCILSSVFYAYEMVPSTTREISFPELKEVLYLKKDNWGISGDKQIMSLSRSKWTSIDRDSENDYILEGLQEVFYKQTKDTLTLFLRRKFKLPKDFESKVVIRQIELENPQFMDLFDQSKLGKVARF